MGESLEEVMSGWRGLATIQKYDKEARAWIFIALHSDCLGVPVGGTRVTVYREPAAGLRDAYRLAEGMTYKWAAAGLRAGGGKAVIALEDVLDSEELQALLRRYGSLLRSLGGCFVTGQDLGVTPREMAVIAKETSHVLGVVGGRVTDPGPYTARALFAAVRATLRRLLGSADPTGRTALVQGVGDVGGPLARRLADSGATVLVSDVDAAKAEAFAAEIGATVVPPAEAIGTACDLFAPCAVGAVLNRESIPRLACRAVCGSANNQLDRPEDADLLHERGILYAPDYIANSGGAIAFHLMASDGSQDEIARRLDGVEQVLDEVFAEAAREGRSPLWAARRRVERMLDDARAVTT